MFKICRDSLSEYPDLRADPAPADTLPTPTFRAVGGFCGYSDQYFSRRLIHYGEISFELQDSFQPLSVFENCFSDRCASHFVGEGWPDEGRRSGLHDRLRLNIPRSGEHADVRNEALKHAL